MEEVITDTIVETKPSSTMTAGEMLRNARTTGRRKRELQTIAKQLCIREDFLQALEDGNYTALPEVVYILGFARNYAIELGLDPQEIIEKIKHELGLYPTNEDAVLVSKNTESKPIKIDFKKFVPMCKDAWAYIVRHWKWAAGIAGGVLLLIILLCVLFSGDGSKSGDVATDAAITESTEPSEPAYTQPVRERFGIENRGKSTIILQANKSAGEVGKWIQIEDARGKIVFTKIMVPGDIFYMPVGNGYRGTFGDVSCFDFWVDGKLAPAIKASRNSKIAITAENLMKPAVAVK